jgi:hypothetical protein
VVELDEYRRRREDLERRRQQLDEQARQLEAQADRQTGRRNSPGCPTPSGSSAGGCGKGWTRPPSSSGDP